MDHTIFFEIGEKQKIVFPRNTNIHRNLQISQAHIFRILQYLANMAILRPTCWIHFGGFFSLNREWFIGY